MCRSIGIVKQSKTQGQTYSVALGTPMFNTSVLGIFFYSNSQTATPWLVKSDFKNVCN